MFSGGRAQFAFFLTETIYFTFIFRRFIRHTSYRPCPIFSNDTISTYKPLCIVLKMIYRSAKKKRIHYSMFLLSSLRLTPLTIYNTYTMYKSIVRKTIHLFAKKKNEENIRMTIFLFPSPHHLSISRSIHRCSFYLRALETWTPPEDTLQGAEWIQPIQSRTGHLLSPTV